MGGGDSWRVGDRHYTLLYLKLITNKVLLCSTGSPANVMW